MQQFLDNNELANIKQYRLALCNFVTWRFSGKKNQAE